MDFSELASSNGTPQPIDFSGVFKGEKTRRIEALVSSHLLSKEFGGAHLIVLAPAFIIVNETDETLRYTYHSSYSDSMCLEPDKFTSLILKSEKGSENISRTVYFNCDPKK